MIDALLAPKTMGKKSIHLPAKFRVLLIVFIALAAVLSTNGLTLWLFVTLDIYLWFRSGLTARQTVRRLLAMDFLILFTIVLIPFSVAGEPVFTLIGFEATKPGIMMAMMILLKANIVMLAVMTLSVGIDALTLGKTLVELGVSRRFALLMQFTVRYIGVMFLEFQRLRQAMKARGFKPCNTLHTWRSYGFLFGMLLVRSVERADRISQAMKCRGFNGQFLSNEKVPVTGREYAHFLGHLTVIILIVCSSFWSF